VIERLARRIVRMQLAPAAIFFIESVRPLNFVGSQLMHFLAPFIHAFGEYPDYDKLATLLEDRRSVDLLLEAIEREEAGGSNPPEAPLNKGGRGDSAGDEKSC